MQKIYCIGGLAADKRLFARLVVPGHELVFLPWLPFDKADTMRTYALKMAGQIPDHKAIVAGLSFGGMLSVEIAKEHHDWKIFLISSAKTSAELGYNSGFLRWLSRKEVIPAPLFHIPNPVVLYKLGVHTKEQLALLCDIIRNSNTSLVRWSINTLLTWNNSDYPRNIIHIHGTNDRVIRSANVRPDHWIEGGSHIMIYDRGAEVGKIISSHLP